MREELCVTSPAATVLLYNLYYERSSYELVKSARLVSSFTLSNKCYYKAESTGCCFVLCLHIRHWLIPIIVANCPLEELCSHIGEGTLRPCWPLQGGEWLLMSAVKGIESYWHPHAWIGSTSSQWSLICVFLKLWKIIWTYESSIYGSFDE